MHAVRRQRDKKNWGLQVPYISGGFRGGVRGVRGVRPPPPPPP